MGNNILDIKENNNETYKKMYQWVIKGTNTVDVSSKYRK